MLRYVKQKDLIDPDRLDGYSQDAAQLLREYTDMPEARIRKISRTIDQKIFYFLKLSNKNIDFKAYLRVLNY